MLGLKMEDYDSTDNFLAYNGNRHGASVGPRFVGGSIIRLEDKELRSL